MARLTCSRNMHLAYKIRRRSRALSRLDGSGVGYGCRIVVLGRVECVAQ